MQNNNNEILKKLDKLTDDISTIKTDVAVMRVENTNHLKHHEASNLLCLERHNFIDKSFVNLMRNEEKSTTEIKSDIKDNQSSSSAWIKWAVIIGFTAIACLFTILNYIR